MAIGACLEVKFLVVVYSSLFKGKTWKQTNQQTNKQTSQHHIIGAYVFWIDNEFESNSWCHHSQQDEWVQDDGIQVVIVAAVFIGVFCCFDFPPIAEKYHSRRNACGCNNCPSWRNVLVWSRMIVAAVYFKMRGVKTWFWRISLISFDWVTADAVSIAVLKINIRIKGQQKSNKVKAIVAASVHASVLNTCMIMVFQQPPQDYWAIIENSNMQGGMTTSVLCT